MSDTVYVISDCKAVTDAYLGNGYALSAKTVKEQLGALYDHLPYEVRSELTVLEIPSEEHAAQNTPERAHRPQFKYNQFMTSARVELVDVLERGRSTSIVAPVPLVPGFNDGHATGDCDTVDLHTTGLKCFNSMVTVVRNAIDQHLDAIAELRKFLESKTS
jgi:hypothetical protein